MSEENFEVKNQGNEKYKILFCRQNNGDKIQLRYWLSGKYDDDYMSMAREINAVIEPFLVSLETDIEKNFSSPKYKPVVFKVSEEKPNVKAPPAMNNLKVVVIAVDKTTEEKFTLERVWERFNITKFSKEVNPPIVIQKKIWKRREEPVIEASKKWKMPPQKLGTLGDTLDKDVSKLVHNLFNIDPVAIAADVNRASK